jgi:hypothetical protein
MLTRRKKVVVAIPVYKREPSELEMFSFARALNVLGNHPICLFYPQGLDLKVYQKKASELKKDLQVKVFAEKYFAGIDGYNELMLSYDFYHSFAQYEYMLLYQLDAFVFEDRLLEWCDKGYDYIGAPWFYSNDVNYQSTELVATGNGGFSLRKIAAILKAIHIKPYHSWAEAKHFVATNKMGALKRSIYSGKIISHLWFGLYQKNPLLRNYPHNEDLFWSFDAVNAYKNFKVPSPETALDFAFEGNPRYCYQMNNNCLPFGCHAWYKYDVAFWSQFITEVDF